MKFIKTVLFTCRHLCLQVRLICRPEGRLTAITVKLTKQFVTTVCIGLMFYSCLKDKYIRFSDKELLLVSYSKGQNLKFIDTNSIVQILEQSGYVREARQTASTLDFGSNGPFIDRYDVSYHDQNSDTERLRIYETPSNSLGYPFICFYSYCTVDLVLDSLSPPLPALTVNEKTYANVYSLKLVRNGYIPNSNTDTTVLHYNKEYGVIEMLFPDGKKIVRTE